MLAETQDVVLLPRGQGRSLSGLNHPMKVPVADYQQIINTSTGSQIHSIDVTLALYPSSIQNLAIVRDQHLRHIS